MRILVQIPSTHVKDQAWLHEYQGRLAWLYLVLER